MEQALPNQLGLRSHFPLSHFNVIVLTIALGLDQRSLLRGSSPSRRGSLGIPRASHTSSRRRTCYSRHKQATGHALARPGHGLVGGPYLTQCRPTRPARAQPDTDAYRASTARHQGSRQRLPGAPHRQRSVPYPTAAAPQRGAGPLGRPRYERSSSARALSERSRDP